jgi:hypothetical protein
MTRLDEPGGAFLAEVGLCAVPSFRITPSDDPRRRHP